MKAGFATAPDYAAINTPVSASGIPTDQVINLTDRVKPDGTLDWTPPMGAPGRSCALAGR
jgi:hypothetical protein